MSARASVLVGMLLALGLAGCAADEHAPPAPLGGLPSPVFVSGGAVPENDDDVAPLPAPGPLGPGVTPLDGFLEGALGGIDVAATPYRLDAFVDPGHAHIALFVEGDRGEAMVAVDLAGGLDHPALADGRAHTFTPDMPPDPAGFAVSGIGCSGLRAPSWDWDQPATSVTVRVTSSPSGAEQRVELDVDFGTGFVPAAHARGWVSLGR